MTTVHMFAFNSTIAAELKSRITPELFSEPLKWTPSPYQQALFDWVANGKGSAVVDAVAGSGKTTSIIASLKHLKGVSVKDVRASTFHSVGYAAVLKRLGLKAEALSPDGSKVKKLARLVLTEEEHDLYGAFAVKLVGLAKGEGIRALEPDVDAAWLRLVDHHDMYLDGEGDELTAISVARRLLRASNLTAMPAERRPEKVEGATPHATIDFDDMLYLPLLWRLRLWQDDVVYVDELQDTNKVRRAIARLKLKPGGRFVGVGDPRQAIYGFTGASTDAMDLVQKEFNAVRLPLSVSYRCPKAIARKVRPLVPHFEVPETAAEGCAEPRTLTAALSEMDAGDLIVCRQTAPLVSLALGLISRGRPCRVMGKEIGQGLVALVEKLGRVRGVPGLLEALEAYRLREVAKHTAKGEELKAEGVEDRCACVLTIVDSLPEKERTVPGFRRRVDEMFSDDGAAALTLATVHKVKGKEHRRVAVLAPELMPSKWARQQWQIAQEENLRYVAWTRAQEMLFELTDSILPKALPSGKDG